MNNLTKTLRCIRGVPLVVGRISRRNGSHGGLPLLAKIRQEQIVSYAVRTYGSKSCGLGKTEKDKKCKKTESDSESDSDSDGELDRYSHRGESEFWRMKMRTLHRVLDVNKDGVVSFDDFVLLADRFSELGHVTAKRHAEFKLLMQAVWEAQYGTINQFVTTEQFLEEMHHALNDKPARKKLHKFLPYLFQAVDKDKSGEITVEEFKLFFKCLGLDNEAAVVSFSAIDENCDGRLSIKEFVHLGREFFLSEDEGKASKLFWGPLTHH